ncbi:hypothetical protein, partial [Jatrophihabitans endophyticus]|uniref:hypothetical protein n=1 Tax=Jatrophihabitans endophyticus TaxID=1206085 RepID=UPI0019E1D322
DPELRSILFERCLVLGPALLQPIESRFVDNDYGVGREYIESALWTVSPWTTVVPGSIVARHCVFRDCTFAGVAFAGASEVTDAVRTAVVGSLAS